MWWRDALVDERAFGKPLACIACAAVVFVACEINDVQSTPAAVLELYLVGSPETAAPEEASGDEMDHPPRTQPSNTNSALHKIGMV